jgi:acyl-CoA synthetase (AMP-forming)/AMP-acid ligase II
VVAYAAAMLAKLGVHLPSSEEAGVCGPVELDPLLLSIVAGGILLLFAILIGYMQRRHKLLSDVRMGLNFLSVITRLKLTGTRTRRTFQRSFKDTVARWPNKVAVEFVDDGRKLTFREMDLLANKFANFFASQGLRKGDVAAMMMTNKPEYICIELALAKIGVVSALFNYNLKGNPLSHSIKVAEAKIVIYDSDLGSVLKDISGEHPSVKFLSYGPPPADGGFGVRVDELVQQGSDTEPDPAVSDSISQDAVLSLVYTSGTTGLPKAAIIKHKRVYLTSVGFAKQFNISHSDKIYCTLPLYHSSGGNIGLGMMINLGSTLVLRSKFSARNFFKDLHDTDATVCQYIGELCRYLLATPPSEYDTKHSLRLAFGNGLRKDVWEEFVKRFKVKEIGEFYGATEGNVVFFNYWGHGEPYGAIGKGGFLNRLILGWTIVKFDVVHEEPVRDKYGRCIPCEDGEAGELVAFIGGTSEFVGYYKNKEATEKKILRDAFKKGQNCFRSGDLVMADRQSYLHFVDRIGDTFRWKGENVSTTEVSLALSKADELEDINVVGVEVPGKDGRACLAAVTEKEGHKIDLEKLLRVAKEELPAYAVPLFVRLLPKQETTGTFKLMKAKYRSEGIDPEKVTDALFWLDPDTRKYQPFNKAVYESIKTGKAKI